MVADRHILAAYHNKHRWPWATLTPKIGVFSDFFSISGCNTHFKSELRRNHSRQSNSPEQPAYEMFGIKRRFQQCKSRSARFKESSVRVRQIWVTPSKRAVSATVVQFSKRTVADRDRLAAYHNKHRWLPFRGYQHRWTWTTLYLENSGF